MRQLVFNVEESDTDHAFARFFLSHHVVEDIEEGLELCRRELKNLSHPDRLFRALEIVRESNN